MSKQAHLEFSSNLEKLHYSINPKETTNNFLVINPATAWHPNSEIVVESRWVVYNLEMLGYYSLIVPNEGKLLLPKASAPTFYNDLFTVNLGQKYNEKGELHYKGSFDDFTLILKRQSLPYTILEIPKEYC